MCKFCEPTTPFSTDPDFYPELGDKEPASTTNACYPIVDSRSNHSDVLKIEDRCVWLDGNMLFAETSGREYGEYVATVHYCPMCGRSLDP